MAAADWLLAQTQLTGRCPSTHAAADPLAGKAQAVVRTDCSCLRQKQLTYCPDRRPRH